MGAPAGAELLLPYLHHADVLRDRRRFSEGQALKFLLVREPALYGRVGTDYAVHFRLDKFLFLLCKVRAAARQRAVYGAVRSPQVQPGGVRAVKAVHDPRQYVLPSVLLHVVHAAGHVYQALRLYPRFHAAFDDMRHVPELVHVHVQHLPALYGAGVVGLAAAGGIEGAFVQVHPACRAVYGLTGSYSRRKLPEVRVVVIQSLSHRFLPI